MVKTNMKKPQLSQKTFNRLVIITTLLFVALCGTFSEMTVSQAKETVNHDSIQAVFTLPVPPTDMAHASSNSEIPNNAICSLSSVDCDGEEVTTEAPVAPTKPVQRVSVQKMTNVSKTARPIKIGASRAVQERIDYAWDISHDRDFIYTMEYENMGTWSTTLTNSTNDHGITQINKKYHPQIVNDPRFKDWKFQIEQGWKLYKSGTRYYGHDHRWKVVKNFQWE